MKNQTSVFVRFGIASLAILLLLGGFSAVAFAQGGNGSISGTVTDPKGLAVTDANVVVKNVDTGVATPLPTNSAGVYTAPYLQPGNYEISATKSGFETASQTMIVLHVGDKLTIDLQLPLQGQTSTITVTTEAPLVETEKTESSQTVSENQVSGLPLVTRRWENFALLTPAVTTDGTSGLTSFRGLSSLYNGNSVDGANNTQAFFSEARGRAIIVTYVYSPDSIKEFQVASSNYSAEFGQAAGGTVNAVTRSGTNDLHGDLFWNFRYPTLNALDPFGKARGTLTQTVHQQNQFGGSVGAPIIKDKLWFFGTYDGFRKSNPILYLSTTSNATINGFTCPGSVSATTACRVPTSAPVVCLRFTFARSSRSWAHESWVSAWRSTTRVFASSRSRSASCCCTAASFDCSDATNEGCAVGECGLGGAACWGDAPLAGPATNNAAASHAHASVRDVSRIRASTATST